MSTRNTVARRWSQRLLAVFATVLLVGTVLASSVSAGSVMSASATRLTETGCQPGFVSGDTEFVYVFDGTACRAYLVYYATLTNQGYSPESWASKDLAYPGWLVIWRHSDGGVILWRAGIERYVNPARGVDVSYPAPAG